MALDLDLVSLDTHDWTPHVQQPDHRSWFTAERDAVLLRRVPTPSPENTVEGWRARATQETGASGGLWLSFDEEPIDGCRAFRGVFKFPASRLVPQLVGTESAAVYVVGLIVVPLGGQHLLVNAEALEKGTTGMREAIWGLQQPKPEGEPVRVTGDELWERIRSVGSHRLPSDDERHDALAPSHPLSRVRAHQRRLVGSMRLAPELRLLAT